MVMASAEPSLLSETFSDMWVDRVFLRAASFPPNLPVASRWITASWRHEGAGFHGRRPFSEQPQPHRRLAGDLQLSAVRAANGRVHGDADRSRNLTQRLGVRTQSAV